MSRLTMPGQAETTSKTPSPPADPAADGSDDLRDRVHGEPIAATADEIDDAFAGLAALLLDFQATRRDQGALPTPIGDPIRPDARRRTERQDPSPAGGEAA